MKNRVNLGGAGFALSDAFKAPKWETRYETLKTEDAAWEDFPSREAS